MFKKVFAVFLFSLAVSFLYGSNAAFAADGVLEVKSFHMTDNAQQSDPGADVTYFYQISNTGDVPVSDIRITDDVCPGVSYDAVNQDANVDFKLNKGETWSFHCKTTAAAASTSTVVVSGLVDDSPISAMTISSLRVPAGEAVGSGTGGATTVDAVPNGMPNTGGGKAAVRKTLKKQAASANTLKIPAAGTNAKIEAVGKTVKGNMAVPVNPENVGWYSFGAVPGEDGNAVIAGHLDTYSSANGVFKNLDKLQAGDDIYVTGGQDKTSHFKVSRVEVYEAGDAPLNAIFGSSDKARLNLITCAGKWNKKSHQYTHRLVVYTDLVE